MTVPRGEAVAIIKSLLEDGRFSSKYIRMKSGLSPDTFRQVVASLGYDLRALPGAPRHGRRRRFNKAQIEEAAARADCERTFRADLGVTLRTAKIYLGIHRLTITPEPPCSSPAPLTSDPPTSTTSRTPSSTSSDADSD